MIANKQQQQQLSAFIRKPRVPSVWSEALIVAKHGLRVHPVHGIRNGSCTCRRGAACQTPGKHPILVGWQDQATCDPRQIRAWKRKYSDSNAGVVTGRTSGVIVLDVDVRRHGHIGLEILESQYGPLPTTAHVLTGNGGLHYYFRHPGRFIPGSTDQLGVGLELKADGGGKGSNIVLPGSMHPSGRTYEWEWSHHPDEVAFADSPDWILIDRDAVYGSGTEQTDTRLSSGCSVYSVPHAIEISLPRGQGQRHRSIFRLCCALKSVSGYTEADPRQLRDVFEQWWNRARPIVRTKVRDESWYDFLIAWPNAGPLRGDPVVGAFQRSQQAEVPPDTDRFDCSQTTQLLKLCRELQRSTAPDPFYLSYRKAEEVTGIPRMTIGRRLKLLCMEGVLELVERHTPTRATRYFYLGDDRSGRATAGGETS